MSVPTVYTESALQQYMLTITGNLGTVLGLEWIDFEEAVVNSLLAYGVTSIADATDMLKLRTLAALEAWRVALAKAGGYMDFTADGGSFKASQVYAQAQTQFLQAENAAMVYGGGLVGYEVTGGTFVYPDDPYPLPSDDEDS